jgi:chitinase
VYGTGRALDTDAIAASKLTHINYAFANVKNGLVVDGAPGDAGNLRRLGTLRAANPDLRLLVSIGGWSWSKGFSDAALNDASRQTFVTSAITLLRRYDLDGLDIDWEYPGLEGDSNPHRPDDGAHFVQLTDALRKALDAEGRSRKRHFLLTCAAGAFPDALAHSGLDRAWKSLDYVNLMTYDFRVQEVDRVTGHHANLYLNSADTRQLSADGAVTAFTGAGIPASRIVLGMPFYGRAWVQVPDVANGLFQDGAAPSERLDLSPPGVDALLASREGWVRHWDSAAQAPYLWNAAKHIFASIEDEESATLKGKYVRKHGLAGVMFWEYGSDPSGRLLDAVNRGLGRIK